jgi:hypothetical protein
MAVRRALMAIAAAIARLGGRSKDGELWRAVRHAMLTVVAAIEQQWGTGKDSNHHG